ncbi:hypothetical protein I302_102625 [Kwoniella bestiolae CBS 10118]|uniref:Sterility protein Ste20 n=1 Tax=Kwoniella bestiolae CBS 10118 TaxID=1296100 RepID=A0A1B9GFR4_9TREE|nr:sterility protein Ste20 [Kwoniella bestiolae CBS 10118]OCF29801.1 sterility protein Ste20 [Kwoniella bestiolae CBS 10118]
MSNVNVNVNPNPNVTFPRPSPSRPSVDGQGIAQGQNGNGNTADENEENESIESIETKLGIERRVQYGAEKMLDVIEQKESADGGDQEKVKENITAQLEAANERIKSLEARLEKLRGTPQRTRRRPQPRLNGYPSNSSLGPGGGGGGGYQPSLSSSLSSSLLGSTHTGPTGGGSGSGSSRPKPLRYHSNLTPEKSDRDRENEYIGYGTPSKGGGDGGRRPRSKSAGEDAFNHNNINNNQSYGTRVDEDAGTSWKSASSLSQGSSHELSLLGGREVDENFEMLLDNSRRLLRRLKELGRAKGKGKGKARDEGNGNGNDEEYDLMIKLSEALKMNEGLRVVIDIEEVVQSVIPFLGDSATPRQRAAGYRLLRYSLTRQSWGKMIANGMEWLIIRTFTRDAKAVHEREQALRLLRAVIVLPPLPPSRPASSPLASRSRTRSHSRNGHAHAYAQFEGPIQKLLEDRVPLTDGLVRAIVSAAENPDDAMRTVCMETLVEIGILDIRCLIQSNAFRTVLLAFKDGPSELGPAITGLLLYLVNQPSTRELLLPGGDLEAVLVGLTEAYGKIPTRQQPRHLENLQNTVRNIGMLLSSWSGLLYMCMDDYRAIKSLISSLHVPNTDMRNALMDLLFVSLRIKSPTWTNAFLDGKRLTVYTRTQEATTQQLVDDGIEEEDAQGLTLVDHFVALLLTVFLGAGLLEALIAVIEEDNGPLNRKATLLLGEILQMANRVLPLKFAAQLQSLPQLFSEATDFKNPGERMAALSALSSIDSLNRNASKAGKKAARDKNSSLSAQQDPLERGQRQVQSVKLRLGLQVEDKQFQQMIVDSGLLLHRDHTKWNYEIIVDLIEGPLLNPKRLDEAIKATKFVRRLFSFFHPYNYRFGDIKRTRPNHKWVKLGCSLISTMLSSAEGIKYITEDKLLKQMLDCFNELDQYIGQPTAQPIFARDRLENTLTYGYFEMIGTLSRHHEGMKLLEKFKFFTCFYHLSEQRSRDDIIRIIIECFDYTLDAHPRIVLSKALTSSYMETRLFATHHLGGLIQEQPNLLDWGLQLMITQLYDTSMEVCDVAVMYLEEACTDPNNLEKVVQLRPTLEHLGDVGHPLFMRFVSTSVGFRYLHQAQYIDRELESWLVERNLLYVIEAETFVSKTIRPWSTDTVEDYWIYDGPAPTHFLGELTKTPEGCQLIKEKGIVAEFAEIVRLHGMEAVDQGVLTNLKSVLWALGNIGSTEGGLPFLEDEEIIEDIVEIAEQSPILTIRGTCFFVIGLISTSRMGAEILEEFGWISTRTPLGHTTGLCLPNDISRFVNINTWERSSSEPTYPPLPKLSGLEAEIMTSIANLSNYVLAAGAMNNLKKIRTRHPRYFSSIILFHRALRSVSTNHYQAPVRRFILDLFEVRLDAEILTQLVGVEGMSWRIRHDSTNTDNSDKTRVGDGLDVFGNTRSPLGQSHGVEDGDKEKEKRSRSKSSPGPLGSGLVSHEDTNTSTNVRGRGKTFSGGSGNGTIYEERGGDTSTPTTAAAKNGRYQFEDVIPGEQPRVDDEDGEVPQPPPPRPQAMIRQDTASSMSQRSTRSARSISASLDEERERERQRPISQVRGFGVTSLAAPIDT